MPYEKGKAFSNIASGLGSLGGVASTVAGIIGSIGARKRQKDLMDYQYQKNLDLYNKQFSDQYNLYKTQLADQRQLIQEERDYNDFSSVAARARAAGVNPLAIFGNGGVGIQSSSGSTPNSSVPGAGSVSVPGADNIGGNLIAAGSTITNIARQSALLDAEKRAAEAEANLKEIEAAWADRKYDVDYREKESNIALRNAQIGTEKQRERLVTLQGNMQEILNRQQGPLGDMQLRKLSEEIRLFGLEAQGLEIKNSKQAEILDAQLAESRARVYETYESVRQKYIELEQNAEKLNLSKQELEEVKRANKELEQFRDDELKFKESSDKKNRTQRYILGSVNAACRVADTVAGFINPLKNIASSRPSLVDSWADSGYIFAE